MGTSVKQQDVSNFEGIPTVRYSFLKKSILSVSQVFNSGRGAASAKGFRLTEAQVDSALGEVATGHVLVSQAESDYEGFLQLLISMS